MLDLFGTAVGAIDRKARRGRDEQTKAHVVAASDTVSMFARVARILLDPEIPNYRVHHAVWDEVGRDTIIAHAASTHATSHHPPLNSAAKVS